MKNVKKLLALVLAVAICAAFALPALANEGSTDGLGDKSSNNYTLTLNNPAAGHTYKVYQLFTGNPAHEGDDWYLANVAYGDVNDGGSGWKMEDPNGSGDFLEAPAAAEKVAGYNTETAISNFLAQLPYDDMKPIETEIVPPATEENPEAAPITWKLPGGYYVIKDVTDLLFDSDDVISGIMVRVVGSTDVNIKSTKPVPKKDLEDPKVLGNHDYSVGDKISYVLTAKVPVDELDKYVKPNAVESTYNLTFCDYMPPQLTYLGEIGSDFKVDILVAGSSVKKIENYSVTDKNFIDTVHEPTFELTIDLFNEITTNPESWKQYVEEGSILVQVSYKAMLNEVKIEDITGPDGKAIKNVFRLVYPNNPYDSSQEGGSTITPPHDVPVYTFELNGKKVDESGNPLANAVFELWAEDGTAALGLYKMIEDDGSIRYVLYNENSKEDIYKTSGEKVTSVTTGEDGAIKIEGLDSGVYILKEIEAPAGYNLCADITVEIVPVLGTDGKLTGDCTYTITQGENIRSGATNIEVLNQKGSTLPSTGGIGTTIFYVVGAVLVVGAGVLLFAKRRARS